MSRSIDRLSRRDLIKAFGLAGVFLHPLLRATASAKELNACADAVSFEKAPRYVHFFKGGAFQPNRTIPAGGDALLTAANLQRSPLLPLKDHVKDMILFRNMSIHGGSPKTTGYKEEHAAGIMGCATGHRYHYSGNDAYYAYTDHESIDVRIQEHYQNQFKDAPFAKMQLTIGAGAHSDADGKGPGNRFISFRKRKPGEDRDRYANAISPEQNAGNVYKILMARAAAQCQPLSNQPASDTQKLTTAASDGNFFELLAKQWKETGSKAAGLGLSRANLESVPEQLRQFEQTLQPAAQPVANGKTPVPKRKNIGDDGNFAGDGSKKQNLDQLSPVHDQMIQLIKFAFENDLTRVVAFTLSGASSGQTWPKGGINTPHHSLEHSGRIDDLVKLDSYYAEKFALLLNALEDVKDPGGRNALHNSMVFMGMECWSNGGHYLKNIPFVFAGQGGGRFKTGMILDAQGRNNNDIHLSCLKAAGVDPNLDDAKRVFGLPELCKGPIIPELKA